MMDDSCRGKAGVCCDVYKKSKKKKKKNIEKENPRQCDSKKKNKIK